MAEAISLFVDIELSSIDVQLDVDLAGLGLGGEEAEVVHEAEGLRAEWPPQARLQAATRRSARALASQGVTLRDSSVLLGSQPPTECINCCRTARPEWSFSR